MAPVRSVPDALVLGAGGTLGIAWLRGLLAGLEEASGLDLRESPSFIGTSAGSFVAAALAAGARAADAITPESAPDAAAEYERETAEHELDGEGRTGIGSLIDGPAQAAGRLATGGARLASAISAPLLPIALAAARPPGAVARRAALALAAQARTTPLDFGHRTQAFGSFDGRLRIVTVDRRRGTRTVFGAPDAPEAQVADAVRASCSVPWLFSPVRIDGREYVDGGVWSLSNLDVAPVGRGADVLALLPTFRRASSGGNRGGLGALRALSQAVGLTEARGLRARGTRVRIVAPDAAATLAIGHNPMDPRPRHAVFAAGVDQGRRLAG